MFKLSLSKTYEWPISVSVPAETGGEFVELEFTAIFHRGRVKKILQNSRKTSDEKLSDTDTVAQMLAGWKDVMAEDDTPLPYNRANLTKVLEVAPGLSGEIATAFFESATKAQEKNSAK